MNLTKERIDHYIRRFDQQAAKAECDYRIRLDHRYIRKRIEAEEIASALRIARNQAEEQHELTELRQTLGRISEQAVSLMQFGIGSVDTILKELAEVGRLYRLPGGVGSDER